MRIEFNIYASRVIETEQAFCLQKRVAFLLFMKACALEIQLNKGLDPFSIVQNKQYTKGFNWLIKEGSIHMVIFKRVWKMASLNCLSFGLENDMSLFILIISFPKVLLLLSFFSLLSLLPQHFHDTTLGWYADGFNENETYRWAKRDERDRTIHTYLLSLSRVH